MKQMAFFLLLASFSHYHGFAQEHPDAILGKWLKLPKEDLIIEMFRTQEHYNGKITWSKPGDKKKPVGFIIIDNLKYNAKSKKWDGGKIHDPNSSHVYSAEVKLN